MRYLMSTSIIPAGWRGPVGVEIITFWQAKRLLEKGYTSAVGHAATAELLTNLFNLEVTHNRISVSVQPGDEFIAFQLLRRPPEGVVLDLESLQEIGYELRLIKFSEIEVIETAEQARRVIKDALNEITGAVDAPEDTDEAVECVRFIADAIEDLDLKARHILEGVDYTEECGLADALREAAEDLITDPRCNCGVKACKQEACGFQMQDREPICTACCAEAWGPCPIQCPLCGERVIPTLPGDYVERRTRDACGPYTPGYCGDCGATWD